MDKSRWSFTRINPDALTPPIMVGCRGEIQASILGVNKPLCGRPSDKPSPILPPIIGSSFLDVPQNISRTICESLFVGDGLSLGFTRQEINRLVVGKPKGAPWNLGYNLHVGLSRNRAYLHAQPFWQYKDNERFLHGPANTGDFAGSGWSELNKIFAAASHPTSPTIRR